MPKSNGGIRPITDCSRPIGKSVNYHCETLLNEFCFKNVEDVVSILENDNFMTVIDIKSAYRAVPIRAKHRKFQGFEWVYEGKSRWFVDNRLCFGSRLGPMYFNFLSSFIHDVLTEGGNHIVNYFDDFIAVAHYYATCKIAQNTVIQLLRFLGFHVAFDKLICPSTCVYLPWD